MDPRKTRINRVLVNCNKPIIYISYNINIECINVRITNIKIQSIIIYFKAVFSVQTYSFFPR